MSWGTFWDLNCDTLVFFSRFVSDRVTWDLDSQFLLGPAFLVSPVLEPVSMGASDDWKIPPMRLVNSRVEKPGLEGS